MPTHRKLICLLGILWLYPIAAHAAADAPRSIAGFSLGEDIAQLQPRVRMESRLPLRHEEYLQEVETQPQDGFKSGLIIYGSCAAPGRVVRIKLKYADASRQFYDRLLQEVEKRWGKPDAYEGDPFHIVLDWKWVFNDGQGNRITLHLGHNTRDADEKLGNTIKLTLLNAIEAERACYLAKHPEPPQGPSRPPVPPDALSTDDWQRLLPH
jgi:hypothetical protein